MAKQISPFSISAPGFYGLNLSDSPVDLSHNFALVADNCVIDKSGRVASRKGWSKAHAANTDLGSNPITCIGELIQNDGTATVLATGGGYLFKLSATTLTTLTYGGGGVAPTITANNWQFCQLSGVAIFWQSGYDPLIYDPAVSTTTFRRLNEKAGTAGTVPKCNTAISAYGRIWAANTTTDKNTIAFSDLLSPHIWSGGTSGTLNLLNVWPKGGDEIVALAAHNNFLFVFGKKQILVYSGANTPSTMTLQDSIVGIGCVARNSVANIGEDVWFLSSSGVRSLERTIQEKSAPSRNISKNVHDEILSIVEIESTDDIKASYSALNSFYLLTSPSQNLTYCFDTRARLEDGSARTTIWRNITPTAFHETLTHKFYLGMDGYIGLHSGYLDDTETYRMSYYSTWIDFPDALQSSIIKSIILTVIGGANQDIVVKWGYDFIGTTYFEIVRLTGTSASAEYGIAEYGIGEYSGSTFVGTVVAHGSSSGKVIQFGIETEINNKALSIQKIDVFSKNGRY
jgi:hypothetical protein